MKGIIAIENPVGDWFVSLIHIMVDGLNKGIVVSRAGGGKPLILNVRYPDRKWTLDREYALGVYVLIKRGGNKDKIAFHFQKIQDIDASNPVLELIGRQMSTGRFVAWKCSFQKVKD